jgi:hypothetical protein
MRAFGRNWEAPNANKMHENRSVRIGQVELAKRKASTLPTVGAWVRSSYLTGTEIPDREVPFLRAAGNHT